MKELFNTLITVKLGTYNLFGLTTAQVQKLIEAYLTGKENITIAGTNSILKDLTTLRIFLHESNETPESVANYYLSNINFHKKGFANKYLPAKTLLQIGREVTYELIGDKAYGENTKDMITSDGNTHDFINKNRLLQLRGLSSTQFDFTKLIRLCEELNSNYRNQNYLSVGMIARTIINHIPPVFGLRTFDEVSSNYGASSENKSFKRNMSHLNSTLKNIADSYLHLQIRKSEVLPNETQVDFHQDFDVLLAEIIRISK